MKYWDTSAIVPLLVAESSSAILRMIVREDDQIATWSWTRTEVVAAIERRAREGIHSRHQRLDILIDLDSFAVTWDEITDTLVIRTRAHSVLSRHALKAADAGHLGSALLVQDQLNEPLDFVCLDHRLSSAAQLEGLRVVPELGNW